MSDAQGSRAGSMFGPYHLKRLLGRGGMGEVYEAEHTVKEWTVAVKLMSDTFSKDPVFRERMKREARIAGRLQEPHVVPIHDYGEIDGQMFMEMRLVEGTDLDSLLKRFGPLTPPRAVAIITQTASALDAAHAAGVMHRDVKPPNILVTRDDFAYLVDFGIASATTDEKLTQLGTAVGTWKYMAPERFSNDEVTYRADIYALACVLHESLTGSPPYRADSASSLVTAHLMDPIPQPSTVRSGIPKGFDDVIARGMAKMPEDRYASAGDLAMAAHEALSDPDQDHAVNILRRSQEATLPAGSKVAPPPTLVGTTPPTSVAHSPVPTANTPPPSAGQSSPTPYAGPASAGPISGPVPQSSHAGQPWGSTSGPIPAVGQPVAAPAYYQGSSGNWGGPPPGATPPQQFSGPIPWNQPPAKPKRNPWPIIATVAVVLVVVVSGVGIWLIFRPKPVPPPRPISSDRLSALLLSSSEINSIVGSSDMQPGKPVTAMDTSSYTGSLPQCQGALYPAQQPAYADTGYQAESGLVYHDPKDTQGKIHHLVDENVISFPTADKANAFVETAQDKWKACAGQPITITGKGETYRWTFGQMNGDPPKIALARTQEGAAGWACQHAISAANNIVVDVDACDYNLNNQASQAAEQIVAKVNNA
jgi:serine/threonine kinase PknH